MKNKIALIFLLSLVLVIASSQNIIVHSQKSERQTVYKNSTGATLPVHKYNQLLDMGFLDLEIEYLTQKEVNEFLKMKPVKISSSEKFYKTSYKKDNQGNLVAIEEELSESETYLEIAKEKENKEKLLSLENITASLYHNPFEDNDYVQLSYGCDYEDNERTCFTETAYKKLIITFVALDEQTSFIKTTVDWLKVPQYRDNDIIALIIPTHAELVEDSWGGKMTVFNVQSGSSGTTDVEITQYKAKEDKGLFTKDTQKGVALFQNLPDLDYGTYEEYSTKHNKIINSLWATATFADDVNSFLTRTQHIAKGAYRHAIKTVNIDSFSFGIDATGLPSISLSGSIKENYDTEINELAYIYRSDLDFSSPIQYDYYEDGTEVITSFYNKNDVFIKRKTMENLIQLGFDFIEIDELTSSELTQYESYNIIKSESSVNSSSDLKRLKITVSQIGSQEVFIKVNMLWTINPIHKNYDLIAIGHNSLVTATKYKGKQIFQEDTSFGYSTDSTVYNYPESSSSYFSEDRYGLVMKHNLVSDIGMTFVTLEMEASYSGNSSTFYGILMHQTSLFSYNISNTEFNKSTSSSIISFNPSSLENKYDTQYKVSEYFSLN